MKRPKKIPLLFHLLEQKPHIVNEEDISDAKDLSAATNKELLKQITDVHNQIATAPEPKKRKDKQKPLMELITDIENVRSFEQYLQLRQYCQMIYVLCLPPLKEMATRLKQKLIDNSLMDADTTHCFANLHYFMFYAVITHWHQIYLINEDQGLAENRANDLMKEIIHTKRLNLTLFRAEKKLARSYLEIALPLYESAQSHGDEKENKKEINYVKREIAKLIADVKEEEVDPDIGNLSSYEVIRHQLKEYQLPDVADTAKASSQAAGAGAGAAEVQDQSPKAEKKPKARGGKVSHAKVATKAQKDPDDTDTEEDAKSEADTQPVKLAKKSKTGSKDKVAAAAAQNPSPKSGAKRANGDDKDEHSDRSSPKKMKKSDGSPTPTTAAASSSVTNDAGDNSLSAFDRLKRLEIDAVTNCYLLWSRCLESFHVQEPGSDALYQETVTFFQNQITLMQNAIQHLQIFRTNLPQPTRNGGNSLPLHQLRLKDAHKNAIEANLKANESRVLMLTAALQKQKATFGPQDFSNPFVMGIHQFQEMLSKFQQFIHSTRHLLAQGWQLLPTGERAPAAALNPSEAAAYTPQAYPCPPAAAAATSHAAAFPPGYGGAHPAYSYNHPATPAPAAAAASSSRAAAFTPGYDAHAAYPYGYPSTPIPAAAGAGAGAAAVPLPMSIKLPMQIPLRHSLFGNPATPAQISPLPKIPATPAPPLTPASAENADTIKPVYVNAFLGAPSSP